MQVFSENMQRKEEKLVILAINSPKKFERPPMRRMNATRDLFKDINSSILVTKVVFIKKTL